MSTPSVEYRSTLEAVALASVVLASARGMEGHSIQYVVPKVKRATKRTEPSRLNDIRVITTSKQVRENGILLNTGGYKPYFLDSVPNLRYTVRIERLATLKPKDMPQYVASLKAKARRSSFSYVEGKHIVTIFATVKSDEEVIRSWKEFADACGLVIGNSTKISKRLKELVRLTRMFVRLDKLDVQYFEHDQADIPQEYVDGASIVRRSVALKACRDPRTRSAIARGEISSVSIRVITPQGLIKGDALIVPDKHIKSDIYTSVHNLKGELATKDGFIITMEPHHPSSPARTNDQILSWFPGLFPMDQLRFTVKKFLAENFQKLVRGEYPTYLTSVPKLKDGIDSAMTFRMSAHKWQAYGKALNESAALMEQMGRPVTQQVLSTAPKEWKHGELVDIPWKQKVKVPIVWAFYGHFMTDTVIRLAGYTIPKEARGKLFFHKETGRVVIPGRHFRKYYRNHGGWDLDDSAMVIIRKIDGELKAIIVRSPNSWGEYSIIDVHMDGLPLYFQYGDIPEVDSSALPTQIQNLILDDPNKDRTLPTGTFEREAEYGYEDFDYALDCAVINPGTGSLINLFCIAYNAIFGTYNRDPFAETEDVVDFTQQNPNYEALLRLSELEGEAKNLLLDALADGMPVDPLIFQRRLNLSDGEKASVGPRTNMVKGIFSQVKDMVEAEVEMYTKALTTLALVPLGQEAQVRVGNTMHTFKGGRILPDMSGIDFRSVAGSEHWYWHQYTVASINVARGNMTADEEREHWRAYSDAFVAKLDSLPEEKRDLTVLNFFNHVSVEGKRDTALFTTPAVTDGQVARAPIDVLLEAMVRHGLATVPVVEADD